jgi:hypothetical protein
MTTDLHTYSDRSWIPKGSKVELAEGYFEPDRTDGGGNTTYLCTLDLDLPCVVLLGPPGIGKSTEFRRAAEAARENGHEAVFVSLASIYTYEELAKVATDSSLTRNASSRFLFLDALDESPVAIPVVQQWILSAAQSLRAIGQTHRLAVRISSRTADWSNQFEEQLREIWGTEGVRVFELPPLTQQQALGLEVAPQI